MSEKPAARMRDRCGAGHTPTNILPGTGAATVHIGGAAAMRTTVDFHNCATPIGTAVHGPEVCFFGALNTLIENQMAVRQGDALFGLGPPNRIAGGENTVVIGNPRFGLSEKSRMDEF